jgi:hypothetical protein
MTRRYLFILFAEFEAKIAIDSALNVMNYNLKEKDA